MSDQAIHHEATDRRMTQLPWFVLYRGGATDRSETYIVDSPLGACAAVFSSRVKAAAMVRGHQDWVVCELAMWSQIESFLRAYPIEAACMDDHPGHPTWLLISIAEVLGRQEG